MNDFERQKENDVSQSRQGKRKEENTKQKSKTDEKGKQWRFSKKLTEPEETKNVDKKQ